MCVLVCAVSVRSERFFYESINSLSKVIRFNFAKWFWSCVCHHILPSLYVINDKINICLLPLFTGEWVCAIGGVAKCNQDICVKISTFPFERKSNITNWEKENMFEKQYWRLYRLEYLHFVISAHARNLCRNQTNQWLPRCRTEYSIESPNQQPNIHPSLYRKIYSMKLCLLFLL